MYQQMRATGFSKQEQQDSTLATEPSHLSKMQLGSSIEGSQIKRKPNRNTINLAKLSLVLKNKSSLNVQ